MNIKQLIDLRITFSGRMSRSAFWMHTLMLIGLTILVLSVWTLLSVGKFTDVCYTSGDIDHLSPGDVFGGWQTWLLGIYSVWLMVIMFGMQVRRMRDVGKSALLPVLWWVLYVGGMFACIMGFDGESAMSIIGALMIIAAIIIGVILLIHTLRSSKAVEGMEAAPAPHVAAWGVALVPWILGVLLYVTCVSSWVEFVNGCIASGQQDNAAALVHFNRAAAKGHKIAKFMLLVNAAQQQDPEALPEVRQLAESGDAPAQFLFSSMYVNGYPGLEANSDEAIKWLKKSADQGFDPAVKQLQSLEKE